VFQVLGTRLVACFGGRTRTLQFQLTSNREDK
jgi:hypothetical protein